MFSANENIALRQHKRRVVQYIEETIPTPVLDAGTSVMAMQVSCQSPGCVPLETVVVIVFPRRTTFCSSRVRRANPESDNEKEEEEEVLWMKDLVESKSGGTYKTKILLPLDQIQKEDVLDALPPAFLGGRRTMERLCIRARDVVLGQIGQIVGTEEDVEGRRLMAEYLISCLRDYVDRDCVPPPVGEMYPEKEEGGGGVVANDSIGDKRDGATVTPSAVVVQGSIEGSGNFVMKRIMDQEDETTTTTTTTTTRLTNHYRSDANTFPSNTGQQSNAMEWRRRQKMTSSLQLPSSESALQRLAGRELHAPGIRRTGCPCCDPDNLTNVVEGMGLL